MAKIKISDLHTDKEKLLISEISNRESISIFGGDRSNFHELVKFGIKSMEFVLLAYAIDSISSLSSSFNNND